MAMIAGKRAELMVVQAIHVDYFGLRYELRPGDICAVKRAEEKDCFATREELIGHITSE